MQPWWLQYLNTFTAIANVAVLVFTIIRKWRGM